MQNLVAGLRYLVNNIGLVAGLFVEHLRLAAIALAISLLIAIPLGWLISRVRWLRGPVLGVLGVIYTIPSLSLFVLLIPVLGLGPRTAIVALIAYAQLVLVRNVLVGLAGIEPSVIEAARGMGMNGWQRFSRVEFPLALPLILAGTRVATLSIIGIGTIAAFIRREYRHYDPGARRQRDPARDRAPLGARGPRPRVTFAGLQVGMSDVRRFAGSQVGTLEPSNLRTF